MKTRIFQTNQGTVISKFTLIQKLVDHFMRFCSNDFIQQSLFLVYAHLSLVSNLQTNCDDGSKIFPVFSCKNFPLVINLWYMFSRFSTAYILRSGEVLNGWTVKIAICCNRMWHKTFMCISGLFMRIFQWSFIKTLH